MFGDVRGDLPGVIIRFSYGELDQATNKFSDENVIGVGGTSTVYRGQLSDGRIVAIKRLRPVGSEGDFEFLSEVGFRVSVSAPALTNFICLSGL